METVIQIVKKFISDLNFQLKDKNINIVLTSETQLWLAENGYDKKMGARPLARLIDNKIKSPLSRRMLFGDLKDGGKVLVICSKDELEFTISEMPKPLTKEEKRALKRAKPTTEVIEDVDQNQKDDSKIL
jgi:ATP-dependent Clp protease ATP-binding subunit ClpA